MIQIDLMEQVPSEVVIWEVILGHLAITMGSPEGPYRGRRVLRTMSNLETLRVSAQI